MLDFKLETVESRMLESMIMGLRASTDETWQKYINPDPVAWIEEHFRIPETEDHRIILAPYQKACLREALSKDELGNFNYSLIVWSDIKKSIKSCIAAAVVLWRAWQVEWGSIKIVANDLKQADSRVAFYLRRSVELNPEMKQYINIKPSGYLVKFPNHTMIEAIPIDPQGEAGGNDDMVCFSELWGAKNEASKKLWTELTLSPTKYGQSFRWVETYAGFSGESPILEQLYDQGVTHGDKFEWSEEYDPPLEVYKNSQGRMFCLWNGVPRMPWQTQEYYGQEAAVLVPNEYRRVHQNEWVSSEDAFISIEWWDGSKKDNLLKWDDNESIIIALDAATEQDCFGIVAVAGFGDGVSYIPRFARAWYPPHGGEILFHTEDGDGPEDVLRQLISTKNVVEVCYDPYQLKDMGQRLRFDMVTHLHEFGQQKDRLIADKALFDKIKGKRMWHDGNLAELRKHLVNANRKTENEHLRIIKRNQNLKIDLAVCLSMATARAEFWQL
jgi:hypothetical protein